MENGVEERLLLEENERNSLSRRITTESKMLWRIAFPGILARVTSFGMVVVTQSFLGHISALDLAAYALIQSIFLRFINGVLLGMSSATETLCGQAFGAGHYHMMGIYLQRSWIVDLVTATILAPLFIFTKQILVAIGQDENVAIEGGKMCLWFIPFLYYFVFSLTIQMFLQAQLKNMVIAWLSAASFCLQLLLSWLFVDKFNWGVPGAFGALNLSGWSMVFGEFVYVFGGWCPNTWLGFTKAAFLDIFPVVKLSISSGIMICLELWYNSILVLLAGYMKNASIAIAAFSICLNISAFQFMIGLGFLGSTCVRVSNELGKGDAKAAKFSIYVNLATSSSIGVVCFVLCLIFRSQLSYVFTSSEEVADAVSDLTVLLAFSLLINSMYPVLTGAAVGAGVQSTVAYVNLGCYYGVGIPLGVLLGYVADFGIKGLWIGLLSGVVMQTSVLGFIVWRTDWQIQVEKASQRLNRWYLPSEESKDSSEQPS